MPKVKLVPRCAERIAAWHPWIYKSDIQELPRAAAGSVVDVLSHRGAFIGRGFYNPASLIAIRLITRADEPVDSALIARHLEAAINYRKLFQEGDAARLAHAESDFLPGLVVDKFGDTCVMQITSYGMEAFKDVIADTLLSVPGVANVYERNDVPVRKLEGLPQQKGVLRGRVEGPVRILENGIRLDVDVIGGQKTGYFLDQRENRLAIRPLCAGGRVLDCFSHTGAFALNALAGGAKEAAAVEISKEACNTIERNAALNDRSVETVCANVFDYLRASEELWDVIILDPPAFAKNRTALPGAVRGYKEINLSAMRRVRPGGFLVTCSCSHAMNPELFLKTIKEAARDAGRMLRLVEARTQGRDHPILLGDPETEYLKCMILQVL